MGLILTRIDSYYGDIILIYKQGMPPVRPGI